MPCKSCREKRVQIYLARGMTREEAEVRADKVMPLIEKILAKRPCGSCGSSGRFAFLNSLWRPNATATFLIRRWTEYYQHKGFSDDTAKSMAKKLIKRIDKRLKRESSFEEPMFLIERVREGVMFYRRKPAMLKSELRKWVFVTNWKATLFWSVKSLGLRWIGRGYNPAYTLACAIGTCAKDVTGCAKLGDPCTTSPECIITGCAVSGACGCPAAYPNSTQVSACSVACTSGGSCGTCNLVGETCRAPTCSASCAGTCGYDCNSGYTWNGVACVLAKPQVYILKPREGDRRSKIWF